MKKQLVMASLVSAAAVTLFATTANAEDPVNTNSDKVQQTDVGIEFKTDKGTLPGTGPYKDNLAIVWKPGSFNFGTQEALGSIKTYSNTVTKPQYIVVNDDRPDASAIDKTRSAWELKAQLSQLKTSEAADPALEATLTYTLGDAQAYNIGDKIVNDDYVPLDPEDPNSGAFTGKPALTATDNITLGDTAAMTKTTMSLKAGDATGSKVMSKTQKNAFRGGVASLITDTKLVVPDGSKAAGKSYSGKVTWTLSDTLSN
ncbi:WxL domain-containing protein [Enterococcus rotai]|uniref:WxL domain-containing protein n=1 Tax=Enterococcus rotai TaxID=118060 RepID=UPI0035C6A113